MAFDLAQRTALDVAVGEVAAFEVAPGASFAWSHPEGGIEAAAYGEADRREGTSLRAVLAGLGEPRDLPEGMPGPWFGAAAFDGRGWEGFAPLRFTLPSLLLWSDGARHFAAAFGDGARRRLDQARRGFEGSTPGGPRPRPTATILSRGSDIPARRLRRAGERDRWNALISLALTAIDARALDKVVAARAIEVEAARDIDPHAVLAALQQRYPGCRAFLVRGGGGAAFVGATPEMLCRIDGGLVLTEALAGSADPSRAAALLGSRKDLREHRWVVDHVVGGLSGIATSIVAPPEPALRALPNVVHLHTPITARLAPGRGVADVVAALHPTPAVLGVPGAAARRFLEEHEGLERGLYTGLVGWVGPERAELAVALRCALIRGRRARLFVGAGIVEGSSADREWDETELKAHALLDALGVAP